MESDVESVAVERDPWNEEKSTPLDYRQRRER